ncbi:ParB N-terminal domain-containing protein [Streptomyces sp. NPDC050147]|uniref:ParB N-terminal domain-containing protein n=1 Tax=Streptomyces sp. NPDC050147 TaxID=3155513 RepID=UPI0034280862
MKYRGRMRTSTLNDRQIMPTDFRRWAEARRQFAQGKDRQKIDMLKESIEANGLEEPILLCIEPRWRDIYVSDGHHRAIAVLELELPRFPFHWHWIRWASVHIEHEPFPYELLEH